MHTAHGSQSREGRAGDARLGACSRLGPLRDPEALARRNATPLQIEPDDEERIAIESEIHRRQVRKRSHEQTAADDEHKG